MTGVMGVFVPTGEDTDTVRIFRRDMRAPARPGGYDLSAELLLGNEAVAWGAIDAGIAGAFAYPGTPSTEIFETVQVVAPNLWARWSANEKVAYEEALGFSYAGKRALISMKHVGLNVAADPFMSSALTGANGSIVVAIGDDPGMHSSQNEQDSRCFAQFAKIPCFDPSTQQECYDMTREAFRISEEFHLPIMMRLVTRLAHSRANVVLAEETDQAIKDSPLPAPDPNDWILMPVNARRRYHRLLEAQTELVKYSENTPFNKLTIAGRRGLICSSVGYNYAREALGDRPADSILKIGFWPLPIGLIRKLVDHCDEIIVIEEGYPLIEQAINGLLGLPGKTLHGKLDGTIPLDGELTPESVGKALGVSYHTTVAPNPIVAGRPPQLCKGCPHADSFSAVVDAVSSYPEAALFSDIGCYTLGVMPPYRAVHSCVDMGASISMAHGASRAGLHPILCTIGDSTFTHSGMTSIIGAIRSDADITVLILDNATVAMTGTQESMATGDELLDILRGLGVKDLHSFEPLRKHHAANVELIRNAIEHRGLSVLVAKRPCIHVKSHLPQATAGQEV